MWTAQPPLFSWLPFDLGIIVKIIALKIQIIWLFIQVYHIFQTLWPTKEEWLFKAFKFLYPLASLPSLICHWTHNCSLKIKLSHIFPSLLSAIRKLLAYFSLQSIITYSLSSWFLQVHPHLAIFLSTACFSVCSYLCKRLNMFNIFIL